MKYVCLLCVCTIFVGAIALARPLVNQPPVPASVRPLRKTFMLTLNGTGFAPKAVLKWNGSPRATLVLSSSKLRAKINAADVARTGTASLTVVNPGGVASNVIFLPVRKPSHSIAMLGHQVFDHCSAVTVGDFNGDGILDVAWVGSGALNASFGDGRGGFHPSVASNVAYPPDSQMVSGDFNGDGKLDVAGITEAGTAAVFLGNGDGTFRESWSWVGENVSSYVAAADFNSDGNLDLYVTGHDLGGQWFQTFLGSGDGTFSLFQIYYIDAFGALAGVPAIGDFDRDGKLDLAVPVSQSSLSQLYLGNGDGSFNPSATFAGAQQSVVSADMNHDDRLDLVLDDGCIDLGNGDGAFRDGGCIGYGGTVVGTGDFNGDGILDAVLLSTAGSSPAVMILLGNGDGTFQNSFSFPVGGSSGRPSGGIGDFNNDGKLDVIAGNGFLLLQTASSSSPKLALGNLKVGTKWSGQSRHEPDQTVKNQQISAGVRFHAVW